MTNEQKSRHGEALRIAHTIQLMPTQADKKEARKSAIRAFYVAFSARVKVQYSGCRP